MKATERIEIIGRRSPWIVPADLDQIAAEQKFLLKAFDVMRSLAVTYHEEADKWPTGKDLEFIEREFDERMKPFMERVGVRKETAA